MPCPEKFREKLEQNNIPQEIICQINQGFEDLVSSSPKKKKALYFKRATDILCENCDVDSVHSLYEQNACCKGGRVKKHQNNLQSNMLSYASDSVGRNGD